MRYAECRRDLSVRLPLQGACSSSKPEPRIFLWRGSRSAGILTGRPHSLGRLRPPSARGVCLISSSCRGTLTTATDSALTGRRLQVCALRTVLRAEGGSPEGPPPLLRAYQIARSGPVSFFSHPRPIALHCPPPEGAGGGAERRVVGVV